MDPPLDPSIPGYAPVVASNGAVYPIPSDPASPGTKKRRGRPPKPKPERLQAAVPVFGPPMDMNAVPVVYQLEAPMMIPQNVAIAPIDGSVPASAWRGRGRPPKQQSPGRSPKIVSASGKGRGRPKKVSSTLAVAPAVIVKRSGRPRGRPPKLIDAAAVVPVAGISAAPFVGGGGTPVGGKGRGRPPKAFGSAKKPRKFSGKPLGRPKKIDSSSNVPAHNSDSQLVGAFLDLKVKYETLQSRIMQATSMIRPCLNNEGAISALIELELLASVNVNAPANIQIQQPQPEPQPLEAPPYI